MQKRALRIITCSKYNAHTMPILKDLNLLKIEDIFKLHQLKFYYKLVNKQLPAYFDSITCVRNNERYHYPQGQPVTYLFPGSSMNSRKNAFDTILFKP